MNKLIAGMLGTGFTLIIAGVMTLVILASTTDTPAVQAAETAPVTQSVNLALAEVDALKTFKQANLADHNGDRQLAKALLAVQWRP